MNPVLRKLILFLPLFALQVPAAGLAQQPAKAATAVAELALYEGPDRMQRLVEGAKKEGELTVYEGITNADFMLASDAFTKKYGIKVKIWRSSSENVLARIVGEERAGRSEIDLVENAAAEMEALHRERVLQAVNSPEFAHLMPQAVPPHREWAGHGIMAIVQGYNPKLVKKEELPKSYQDLLDPRWKGRLGIEANDQAWFATLSGKLGEETTHKLFGNIVATNGISVRKGHTLLAKLLVAGEVPLGLTLYSDKVEEMRKKGEPIEWFTIPPTIALFVGVGIMKTAPHPHAALLFYDFMLNEGQRLLASIYYIPTTDKVDSPFMKNVPLTIVDPAQSLDMQAKWVKAYEEIVTKRAK